MNDSINNQDLIVEARKYKTAEEFVRSKINAFHATAEKFDTFKIPTFFARNKEDAIQYEGMRGIGNPTTIKVYLDLKHPFITGYNKEQAVKFIELINRAGYKVNVIEGKNGWNISEEQTKPIRENSPYDGENLNDWIYVPKVREQLIKEGYDGLEASDVFSNYEIDIIIPLNTNQIFTEPQLVDIWNNSHD